MKPHQVDALRVRRAKREIAQRRRRRLWAGAVFVLTLIIAAGALVARNVSSRGSHRHAQVASSAPGLALVSRARAEAAAARIAAANAALAAQLAASRRLAATGRPLYCGGSEKRVVALTFDDGPGVYTRLAVKKLHDYRLLATFFLVGKEIRAWPHLVRLEKPVAAFGDHTMTHPFLPALPHAAMVREIAGAKALIVHATGEPVVLFRPPYEGWTPAIEREVRALGMVEVLWNVDSRDSLGANYAAIERNVIAGLKPGSIILMHENRGQTIRALPSIFAALKRDHLKTVTLPELIAEDPPSRAQLAAGTSACGVVLRAGNGA